MKDVIAAAVLIALVLGMLGAAISASLRGERRRYVQEERMQRLEKLLQRCVEER
jgi:hypothetical protein